MTAKQSYMARLDMLVREIQDINQVKFDWPNQVLNELEF
jgi:hypothetical protein